MPMPFSRAALAAGIAFTVAACATDATDSTDTTAAPADAEADAIVAAPSADQPLFTRDRGNATVYVVHGIDGRDLGAAKELPVDVAVNGACLLNGFSFKSIAGPLSLTPGSYAIAISLANAAAPCSNPAVISATVPFAAGERASVVAHLSEGGAPTASKFENPVSYIFPAVAARHTANFSAVDLIASRGRLSRTFAGLTNGNQVAAHFFPGRVTLAIAPTGTTTTVFEATVPLQPFTAYLLYAVGTPANGTFDVIVQTIANRPGRGN
jgi:hypothetical protein